MAHCTDVPQCGGPGLTHKCRIQQVRLSPHALASSVGKEGSATSLCKVSPNESHQASIILDSTIHPGISQAISDMTILLVLLFFLLRPGEYADTNSQSTPFTINDVSLCYWRHLSQSGNIHRNQGHPHTKEW